MAAVALGLGARLLLSRLGPAIARRMAQLASARTLKSLAVGAVRMPFRGLGAGIRMGRNIFSLTSDVRRVMKRRTEPNQSLNNVQVGGVIENLAGLAMVGGFFAVFNELENLMKKGISLDHIKDALNLKREADLATTALYITTLAHALRDPEIAKRLGLDSTVLKPQNSNEPSQKGFNLEPPAPKL